jgi:hypothetical protein
MDIKALPRENPAAEESLHSDVQPVHRIKPAAIKTVPMVSSTGEDIGNIDYGLNPSVDEAIVSEAPSDSAMFKFVKLFSALLVFLIIILLFVAILAHVKILRKDWSPAHILMGKVFGTSQAAQQQPADQSAAPVVSAHDVRLKELESKQLFAKEVANEVKAYVLPDGLTLEQKVNGSHPNMIDQIQWTADPSVDPDYYSIAVRLPPNQEGYSLTYRFNYNIVDKTLAPTTSEANNLMTARVAPPPATALP